MIFFLPQIPAATVRFILYSGALIGLFKIQFECLEGEPVFATLIVKVCSRALLYQEHVFVM